MSLLRKGLLVSAGQFAGIPLSMAAGVIFARLLGPERIGQYELFRNAGVLASTFLALGVGNANIYFMNNRRVDPTLVTTNSLKAGAALGAVLTVFLGTVVLGWTDYFGPVGVLTALVFALGTAFQLNTNYLRALLVARLAARPMVLVDMAARLSLLGIAGMLWLTHAVSAGAAIMAAALSYFVSYACLLYFLRDLVRWRCRFDWKLLREVVAYGIKLAAANLLQLLASTGTVMLLKWLTQDFAAVGLYTRASAVCSLISVIPIALGPLLYAKWAGVTAETRTRQAEMAARMEVACTIAACLGLLVAGKYVIMLLYGQQFVAANDALLLLAPSLVFAALFDVATNVLASDGRAIVSAMVLAGTLVVVTSVTLIATPLLGIRGAALAVLLGNLFSAGASLYACRRLYGLRVRHCLVLRRSDAQYALQALVRRSQPQ
jgi:O-antigen/teichoic acid export membrane protein